MKQLSLNYYLRSLLYQEATAAAPTAVPETLGVYDPCDPTSARLVLAAAAIVLTGIGMLLFARQEPAEET